MAKDAIDGKNQVGNEKNQHKILYHRIYILGAFLLGGVIAAISLWNSDRLLTLMLLATFFSIASIYEMRVRDWTAGPIIGFCCICYALAWVLYQVVGPNFPMETDKEAYLIPSNKPTPRGPCDLVSTKQPDGTVAIFAGSNEFWSDVSGQIDILTLDGTPVVTTRKSERGLLFSIEMFNLEKKLVAKISDNKSILIPKNYAYNKRSKDRSTITLFDDFDKEVLYVEYLNNRTVLIRGVFTGPNGTTVAINDNEILLGFNHGGAGASCWANFPGGIKFDGGSIGM